MSIQVSDTITPAQFQQHLDIPFDVPAGVTRLNIDFEYAPRRTDGYSNLLTLTLFDPNGVRGEGHRDHPHQQVTLSASDATPGYIPAPIPPGRWTVVINTHMVLEPITYRLNVTLATGAQPETNPDWLPGRTAPRGPGWYRGDLHAHTLHSDAEWDVPDLVAYARAERLDFVTLSDHNTIAPLRQMDSLAADDLLTMGGMELTTFYGHALALGTRRWFDWRTTPGGRSMTAVHDEVLAAGGTFIIAHPRSIGNPACTGCDWQYPDLMPGKARLVEIWNGDWHEPIDQNVKGLQLWYGWLNQGYRMRATSGSDIHGQPQRPTAYGRNVVYAEELSEHAILTAIRQGHLYISRGLHLELNGQTPAGQRGMMGDRLPGNEAELTAAWHDAPPGLELRWIVDGQPRQVLPCAPAGEAKFRLTQARWCVAEMRDSADQLHAITNPVFLGEDWR